MLPSIEKTAARGRSGCAAAPDERCIGGPARYTSGDCNAAELSAIYAGVYLACRIWPATTGVLICSDSQGALAAADPSASLSVNPAMRRLQQRLREVTSNKRLQLHFKWVKGHQRVNASTSAWLNNQVDRLAGSTRRAARSTP